jgi:hypothetical protein
MGGLLVKRLAPAAGAYSISNEMEIADRTSPKSGIMPGPAAPGGYTGSRSARTTVQIFVTATDRQVNSPMVEPIGTAPAEWPNFTVQRPNGGPAR